MCNEQMNESINEKQLLFTPRRPKQIWCIRDRASVDARVIRWLTENETIEIDRVQSTACSRTVVDVAQGFAAALNNNNNNNTQC
jgi:hypothetical protein